MKTDRDSNIELMLLNITNNDRPGVTVELSEILARYDATILDIGQADIHHTLALGILIKTDSRVSGDLMKDLLFKAYELDVNIRFSPVSTDEYEQWVGLQGKNGVDNYTARPTADGRRDSRCQPCGGRDGT